MPIFANRPIVCTMQKIMQIHFRDFNGDMVLGTREAGLRLLVTAYNSKILYGYIQAATWAIMFQVFLLSRLC